MSKEELPTLEEHDIEIIHDEELLPAKSQKQVEVRYGIFIYIDKDGKPGLDVQNPSACSIEDLLSLVKRAETRLELDWKAVNDPSINALFNELKDTKKNIVALAKAMEGILMTLQGLSNGMIRMADQVGCMGGDTNAGETKEQV